MLIRLLDEAKDFMDEFLKHDLENTVNYNDPELQDILYWLAVILQDLMVIAKKLREYSNEDLQGGGMTLVSHILLKKIEVLWPEKS